MLIPLSTRAGKRTLFSAGVAKAQAALVQNKHAAQLSLRTKVVVVVVAVGERGRVKKFFCAYECVCVCVFP